MYTRARSLLTMTVIVSRPESGLDCRMCAEFARLRCGHLGIHARPIVVNAGAAASTPQVPLSSEYGTYKIGKTRFKTVDARFKTVKVRFKTVKARFEIVKARFPVRSDLLAANVHARPIGVNAGAAASTPQVASPLSQSLRVRQLARSHPKVEGCVPLTQYVNVGVVG